MQEAADQSTEYMYRVRGPPWERKIRKKEKTINTTHPKNADRNVSKRGKF